MFNENLESIVEEYLINQCDKLKINSRDIKKGDIFVALQGKNTHGNKFIRQALSKGAKYIISDKKIQDDQINSLLQVDNALLYLFNIARKKRSIFKGKIIAVTGSIGKTSVKENLKYFLSHQVKVSASIKSYNNSLGVMVSLLNLNLNSDFAIFEIGTNNFYEIKKLTKIVMPHQVIITNIYPTHLENFQNTRNIAIEKSDLFNPKYNPNIELLILQNSNEDEIYLQKLSKKYKIKNVITFGKKNNVDYHIQSIKNFNNFLSKIKLKRKNKLIEFNSPTSFENQSINIIISLIIFEYNNLKIDSILSEIKNIPVIEGRGLFHKLIINNNIITLIDESYNASPVSMMNCIKYFEQYIIKQNERKILILGEMNELGKYAYNYHKDIVLILLNTKINKIVFCGNTYKKILNQINIRPKNFLYLSNELEINKFLEEEIHNNDIILAKGSHSTIINSIVKKLLNTKEVN